jgi:hypothetical protein
VPKKKLRTSEVFVPGKLPAHTYNARDEFALEQSLNDYIEEAGSILTLSGPTKTGKTVLLRTVLDEPIWLDGQGLSSPEELWRRVGDELGIFLEEEVSHDTAETGGVDGGVEVSATFIKAKLGGNASSTSSNGSKFGATRGVSVVARDALQSSGRALVIDDFHFVDRTIQKQIVRALKPLVLAGVPIIFVSISHRVREVVTAEPDMTGRVETLAVQFWTEDDLLVIARKGFSVLNLIDPDEKIAKKLARESYGSPHLMQKFCREVCKLNGIRDEADAPITLEPPAKWPAFFRGQVEEASANWASRLLRGPLERGSIRTKYTTNKGLSLDGYGITLQAIANTGPKLERSKDVIRNAISELVVGPGPANNQTTSVLKNMSRIAALRLSEDVPNESDLEGQPVELDVQPVIDFIEDGPTSSLHIADPFFAFYLAWGLDDLLTSAGSGASN